jgi:hypothetical protein
MEIKFSQGDLEKAREELKRRKQATQDLGVPLKCSKSGKEAQLFFQQVRENEWQFTRAVIVSGSSGVGISRQLSGKIDWRNAVCPHCGGRDLFKCGKCGRLCCFVTSGKSKEHVTCGWCGNSGVIAGVITALDGSAGGKGKGK